MSTKVRPNWVVRPIKRSDCDEVRQIWNRVNFDLPKYESEIMLTTPNNGIIVAEDIDSGKLLGYCAGPRIDDKLGFIGGYCVLPEYQGLGIGGTIWQYATDYIGDRNIGLIARSAMWTKYRDRSGYKIVAEKILQCFVGKPDLSQLVDNIDGISLQSINEDNIEKVVEYDKKVNYGLDRTALIREITKTPETVTLAAFDNKGEVVGYCVLLTSVKGKGFAQPLYADTESIAELLLKKCCQQMPKTAENGLIYFCWNTSDKAMALANKMGIEVQFTQTTQFTREFVEWDMSKIYCVSSRCFYPN